jgi:prepilin-type N-terminal cleavage/methylation domain-containing protein
MRLQRGFTIVELLVAMAVFTILIGIVVNVFLGSVRNQRAIVALISANDNASLALEQMSRELRTAKNFVIPTAGAPVAVGNALGFENAKGDTVAYRLNAGKLERASCTGVACDLTANFAPITGSGVSVATLRFVLPHLVLPGTWPPRIAIALTVGSVSPDAKGVVTNLQTTVSARNL